MNWHFRRVEIAAGLLASGVLYSCAKAPSDAVCVVEAIPASTQVPAGQGALQVLAPTDEYFYVFDGTHQVESGRVNRALNIKPGQYVIKVNNSPHATHVEVKMLTRCSAGGLRLSGDTDEYYYVFDSAKTQLANQKLNRPVALFPGNYTVSINKMSTNASVISGSTTDIKTGVLNVRGSTDEYYYVLDSAGTQLANQKLSRALSFLPGSLTIKINGTTTPAKVAAGGITDIPAGAIVVQGTTDEYYYVFDGIGNQLANAKIGHAISFVPGSYTAKVNSTAIPAVAEAGKTNEYPTATLTVKRNGDGYYYVSDVNGNPAANVKFDRPVALAAGRYTVRIGNDTRAVNVTAGQNTVLNW